MVVLLIYPIILVYWMKITKPFVIHLFCHEGYPSPSFQNRMEVSGSQLYFKASSPPNYEDSEERSGKVMVGVTDGLSRIYVL